MKKLVKKGIADVFVQLCMTKPIDKITVQDIIRAAGISRQTFYNYYKDKSDVMLYLFEEEVDRYFVLMGENIEELERLLSEFFRIFVDNYDYYSKVVHYHAQNNFYDCWISVTRNFFVSHLMQKHGEEVLTPSVLAAIEFHCHGSVNLLLDWLRTSIKTETKELATIIYECMPPPLKALL